MARTISSSLRRAVFLQETGDGIIPFLTISHAALSAPIRVAGDGVDYSWLGETWVGFPFGIQMLTDDEAMPKCQIEMQNVDRKIGDTLRVITSPARLRLDLVAASEFDQTVDPRVPLISTNLLLRSEEMNSSPWVSSLTIAADQIAAPDGTITADRLTATGAATPTHYQTATVLPSAAYIYSAYVRLGTLSAADFKMAFRDDTAGSFIAIDVVPSVVPLGYRWTRLFYALTTPVGCTSLRVYPFRNSGSPIGTFYIWGAQLTPGSILRNYVRTTTAPYTSLGTPPIEYTANHLFLVNVSVNAMTVTGDVVSWDYTQDTWPARRATQDRYPGLFR